MFEVYRSSVLQEDGARFARILAQPTLDHYEVLRDLALSASKKGLMRESLGNQIYALFLRKVSKPDDLIHLDGEAIASILVEKGAISEGGVEGVRLGEVTFSDSLATVRAIVGGQSAFSYTFRLEKDEWKIDLVTLSEGAEIAFRQQMEQSGLSEEEYVLKAVEALSGSRPSNDIWQPPRS